MKKAYTNVNILDGTKDMSLIPNATLIAEDGIIKEIISGTGHDDTGSKLAGCDVYDCMGGYIIPGLINMHVHTPGNGFPKKKQSDAKKVAKLAMSTALTRKYAHHMCKTSVQTHLYSGTTTIRTVGGLRHIDGTIRNEINAGKFDGPRVLSCDEAITVPGGHMEGSVAYGATSKEDFEAHIVDNYNHGVDWIKIMVTGGVLDARVKGEPGEMKMTPEQIKICTDKAHSLGLRVCAHVESTEGIEVALENGVDCIEHGSFASDKALDLFKEKNATLICTISPSIPLAKFDPELTGADEVQLYNARYLMDGMVDCVTKCLDAGVRVGVGTDTVCPYITHYDLWRELEYIHRLIGVPRKDVLYLATLNNAEILGIDRITGSIEPGKRAEFVLTGKNPLDGFDAIKNPIMVVMGKKELVAPKVDRSADAEEQLDNYMASI